MTHLLCFHDLGLQQLSPAGEIIYDQVAAAAYDGKELIFGKAAQRAARTLPQQFNHRYLSTLSGEPLPTPLGDARNFADLIYRHLQTLAIDDTPVTFAVPSHLSDNQLGLLLGISRELDVDVQGFVDLGLAYAASSGCTGDFSVVDLEQHRLVQATFKAADGEVCLVEHRTWEGAGYAHIIEGWMSFVADEFVHRTRFDPLHTGNTEHRCPRYGVWRPGRSR